MGLARYRVRRGTVVVGGRAHPPGAEIALTQREGDALCGGARPVLERLPAAAVGAAVRTDATSHTTPAKRTQTPDSRQRSRPRKAARPAAGG